MKPTDIIHPSWTPILGELYKSKLSKLSTEVIPNIICYPKKDSIFRVLSMPIDSIKVVVIGQDPYPTPNYANGLAFAVNINNKVPVSLANIRKELIDSNCLELHTAYAGNWQTLEHWEEQGIFLLNTALTVESGKPASHTRYWEDFIKTLVYYIASKHPSIWLLWGRNAQQLCNSMPRKEVFHVKGYTRELIEELPINPYWNYVLTAPHPAAESYNNGNAGFFGCDHFYFVNKILDKKGLKKINW